MPAPTIGPVSSSGGLRCPKGRVAPPPGLADSWYRGLGRRVRDAARLDPDAARAFLTELPPEIGEPLTRGYERAVRETRLP